MYRYGPKYKKDRHCRSLLILTQMGD
jgi:hypothetical protein